MMETEGWVSMLTETWPTVQHQTDIRLEIPHFSLQVPLYIARI